MCVFTLDRIGRRWTLYWGSIGMGICIFIVGGLSRAASDADEGHKSGVGGAAIFFVFLFTAIFGATWLTVPWLYPAEIFPLEIRARGNAWGVVGWSIGNGWLVGYNIAFTAQSNQSQTQADLIADSHLTYHVQNPQREDILCLWRLQCADDPHGLGIIPRIQPANSRRDESCLCVR